MVGWAGQPSGWPCRWCGIPTPVQFTTLSVGTSSGDLIKLPSEVIMTQPIHCEPEADFHLQVEDFIISAVAADITGDHALNNEIGMFLLSLLCYHKKQETE
ncbi:hypothetical protein MACH09_43350 [Vibrio sp. MACH09]|nr:hypothetical protein MACH09_43350 [Vibrio sp. MACH09]